MGACKGCGGTGVQYAMRSWFTADGFRRFRCHICGGSKVNPAGFRVDVGCPQRRFRALLNARPEDLPATPTEPAVPVLHWGG